MKMPEYLHFKVDIDRHLQNVTVTPVDDIEFVELRKGKWVYPNNIMWKTPHCSLCGCESEEHGNFCPRCGAYMRWTVEQID